MVTWLVLLGLTLMLAFYVAAEFATVSVRQSRIRQRAEEGSTLAARLLPILADPHRLDNYIAASQIGITIASLVAGAYAQSRLTPLMAPWFERLGGLQQATAISAATITVLVVLTVVQMVLGELVPKSLALQYPTRVALWTVVPMLWSARLMSVFIRFLNGSGGVLLRLLRVPPAGHGHVHSPDEIEYLVAESGKGGVFKPNEQLRLRHALQLGQRAARELMVPRTRIVAVDVDASLDEVTRVAIESPYTRIPVYEDSIDNIIGIVHVRDLAARDPQAPPPALRALMRTPLVLPETITADRLLVKLKAERRTMAVLVDEFGGTAGLITVDNVLDELIGDIADEFRPNAAVPVRLPDGRVRLPARFPVSEVATWTRVRWTSRYATVGGLVASRLREQPMPGDRVVIDGVEVEVETTDRRAILGVLVRPPLPHSRRDDE
ncbi:MAG: HlyC/CorC family transporter [Gemmatimonadetes bacterium]|nr:HlyC/CorC family transporter [Gemmatimonadota bacterium]